MPYDRDIVNCSFGVKHHSYFFQNSNMYTLSENDTQIRCRFHCSSERMYNFARRRGNNLQV